MASERRQLALLAAILMVLVAVVYWQMTREDVPAGPVRTAGPGAGAAPGAQPPAAASEPVPIVALNALQQEGDEPVDTGRDPFRFDDSGRAASRGGGGPVAPARVPAPPAPAGPPVPAAPQGPPPILLKFIGMARQGGAGRLLAVLRDDRGIYYGAEGDVIEGRYRLLRVGNDSVDIAYVDGRGRKTIPLTGGQS